MVDRVLLTGISGFIGGHIGLALLNAGYVVRGSVRDPGRAEQVRATLARHGGDVSRLEFVSLDLTRDAGWDEAMSDVSALLHTASPFFIRSPKDPMELIRPAVDGTTRALTAALGRGVGRIVLTSSVAAVSYGRGPAHPDLFTDADWTDLDGPGVTAYVESKTRAEQAAWEMMERAGRAGDLVAINPSLVLGPLLDSDPGSSASLLLRLMNGSVPAIPDFSFSIVDVRDVAALHVAALTAPAGTPRRVIAAGATLGMDEIVAILRERLGADAGRLPRVKAPDWAIRLYALFDRDARDNISELGHRRRFDAGPAQTLLGRPLMSAEDAVIATARSLRAEGLLR